MHMHSSLVANTALGRLEIQIVSASLNEKHFFQFIATHLTSPMPRPCRSSILGRSDATVSQSYMTQPLREPGMP